MRLTILDITFCAFLLLKFCKGDIDDELPYDFPDPTAETIVCTAMDAVDKDIRINLEGPMMYEDALKLMSWNIKHDFKTAKKMLDFGVETNHKLSVLYRLFEIFTRSCPESYVPLEFLNIIQGLNMIYQNSIANKTNNQDKWEELLTDLATCSKTVVGGEYAGTAHQIEKISLRGYRGQQEVLDVLPPQELADQIPQLDLVIDAMWFAFANAYGACYQKLNENRNSLNNFRKLFHKDFLQPLLIRWVDVGPGVDFGIVVGDYQIDQILMNMRFCVTGTFMKQRIIDRQLVRPIPVILAPGQTPTHNKKTGQTIAGQTG